LADTMFAETGLTQVDIYNTECEIPDYCFAKCGELTKVTLHNDLIGIGADAFFECKKLTEFNILGKLESIGTEAFISCEELTSFTLPNNEVILGNYAFADCKKLATLIFGASTHVSEIKGSIFQGTALTGFDINVDNNYYSADTDMLTDKSGSKIIFAATGKSYGDYTLPSKYTEICDGAFCGVDITSLTITNNNLKIGAYAFANCENLVTLNLPSTSGVVIAKHAFNYATKLATITNLDKVKTIGDYAFANTTALETVVLGEDALLAEGVFFRSGLITVTLGADTILNMGVFQNCTSLTTVNMPEEGGVHIGVGCFAGDTALVNIDLSKTDDTIDSEAFYNCKKLKTANLTNVKKVSNNAFSDCSSLYFLTLPVVEYIGDSAFGRYSQYGGAAVFAELVLPNTLTHIGDGAFLGCSGITQLVIPESVTELGDFVFAYCSSLVEVTLPSGIKKIGTYTFAGCSLLTDINTENIEIFDEYAFISSESLGSVDFSSATEIRLGAFAETALKGNLVANNLTAIGDYAFQNTDITTFTAGSLAKIGEGAFYGNAHLESFVFSGDIEKVEQFAFMGCEALASFYYYENDTKKDSGKINDYATLIKGVLYITMESGKTQLQSIPSAIDTTELTVSEGTYRIDTYAGNGSSKITKLILPDTLVNIGNYAFYGYKDLQTVEFRSSSAPVLEDEYNSSATLEEDDSGYELVHNQFDLFGLELYYFNFIDMVGKKEPIKMILPTNAKLNGYDGLPYLLYFGKVADAERSEYEARDKNLVDFFAYAERIKAIKVIALTDETLINKALSSYNAITQNPTDYGYGESEWTELVKVVTDAKSTLKALQLANASLMVKNVQALLDTLPTEFSITDLTMLQGVAEKINALSLEDRSVLDMTRYNQLLDSYQAYIDDVESEIAPIKDNRFSLLFSFTAYVALSLFGTIASVIAKFGARM